MAMPTIAQAKAGDRLVKNQVTPYTAASQAARRVSPRAGGALPSGAGEGRAVKASVLIIGASYSDALGRGSLVKMGKMPIQHYDTTMAGKKEAPFLPLHSIVPHCFSNRGRYVRKRDGILASDRRTLEIHI